LKRFRQERQRSSYLGMFSGGGMGQRLDTPVEFPLEGLDIGK